jgi:probable HAF family extracellular repeat protein
MQQHTIAAGLIALLFIQSAQAADYEHYVIKMIEVADLGTLGGDEGVANDINDLGEIVGWSYDSAGRQRAFIDRGDGMQDLMPTLEVQFVANGINNLTQVVGDFTGLRAKDTSAFYWEHAIFFVQLHEAVDPKDAPYCGTGASAKAINDAGVIAGIRKVGCNPPGTYIHQAARWQNYASPWEKLSYAKTPANYYAHDINNSGLIVGEDKHGIFSWTGAWVWEAGTISDVPLPFAYAPEWFLLSTPRALGINDNGRVVGSVELKPQGMGTEDTVTRAFWWSGATPDAEQLPIFDNTRNSTAFEINKQQFTVGYADRQSAAFLPRQKRAVIWHTDIGIHQLPLPPGGGGTLLSPNPCEAFAVNDRNSSGLIQAVGYCRVNGKRKAMRWNIWTSIVTNSQF